MELEAALAAVHRIHAYWNACLAHPLIAVVPNDNQGLYATLHHDLYFVLGQRPELSVVTGELRRLIPERPLTHELASALDATISGALLDDFAKARAILTEMLLADGAGPGPSKVDELFALIDAQISFFAVQAERDARAEAERVGLSQRNPAEAASSHTSAPAARSPSNAGRKRVELTYEDARRTYWEIRDALEEAGERRRPTQRDVCDRLAARGIAIGATTFTKRVREWRAAGQPWPPSSIEP